MICAMLQNNFWARTGGKGVVDPRKSGICGQGEVQFQCGRVELPEEVQGTGVHARIEAVSWHTWDRPKEEVLLSKRVSLATKNTFS